MTKVTAAIILQEHRVLIMRRAPTEKFAHKWEFPGGKIEEGETPEACLIREIREELSIEIAIKRFFYESTHSYPQGQIQLLSYVIEVINGEIKLKVHDKLAWSTKSDLLSFDLLPADIPIAKKIMEDLL